MPDRDAELWGEDNRMPTHARVRAFLENVAKRQIPITYQELTKALQILPPHSIHQVTEALERLTEEDAAAGHPFIAALVIGKARGGLPAPGLRFRLPARLTIKVGTSGRRPTFRPPANRTCYCVIWPPVFLVRANASSSASMQLPLNARPAACRRWLLDKYKSARQTSKGSVRLAR